MITAGQTNFAKKKRDTEAKVALFPQLSIKYFLLSLALLLIFSLVLDRFIIPFLEDQGKIVSASWSQEDELIYYWAHARNRAELKDDPVWRSRYWPVSPTCAKAHRILCIGDSFAWGHGYDNMNDIWWRQLGRELDRRGYKDVEVISAGMQGLNTRLELEVAQKVIPKYKPDLVIWGYIPNDAEEHSRTTAEDLDQKLLFRPHRQNGLLEAFKGLYPHLSYQLFGVRDAYLRKSRFGEFTKENPHKWEFTLLSGENWQRYNKTIDKTAAYLKSLDIPSFMYMLPYEGSDRLDFGYLKEHYNRVFPPVRKAFEESGVRVEDCVDSWISAAKKEKNLVRKGVLWFGINPANAHPNRWTTHTYAVHAADILEKDFANLLGARTARTVKPVLNVNGCIPPNLKMQQGDNKVVFVYPIDVDDFRSMPIRKPYVELCLELPVDAKRITLGGVRLKGAEVYITNVDANEHFDNSDMYDLGYKRGRYLVWDLPESRRQGINTINISASVVGLDNALILELVN